MSCGSHERTEHAVAPAQDAKRTEELNRAINNQIITVLYSLNEGVNGGELVCLKGRLEKLEKRQVYQEQQFLCTGVAKKFEGALMNGKFRLSLRDWAYIDWRRIWSVLMTDKAVFPDNIYFRHRIAACLACAYAAKDIDSSVWKGIAGRVLDICGADDMDLMDKGFGELEVLAKNDRDNADRFREGLQAVNRNLVEIGRSVESASNQRDDVLSEILENARNGLTLIPPLFHTPRTPRQAAEECARS